jgi:transcriptional regulator with XRE-family HTH domain
MDKSLILNKIKEYFNFKNEKEMASFLGVTSQVLSNWRSRNTYDVELIYKKCKVFNPEWLLTGEGEELKKEKINTEQFTDLENALNNVINSQGELLTQQQKRIEHLEEEIKRLTKK